MGGMTQGKSGLVLGSGGHAASAWELGVIAGMADGGVDVRGADVIVGTSAGARVGVQISSDLTIDELFQQQVDPNLQTRESAPPIDFTAWRAGFSRAREGSGDARAVLKRFGALALQLPRDGQAERRRVVAARLPLREWPDRRLLIVAVDTESGERRVFDRASGADLVDAVAASGAVPAIWPPVAIGGRQYMDGGVYSIDNADLALGCDRVLILTLPARVPPLCVVSLESAVEVLRQSGAQVDVVHPDEASQGVFAAAGGNLLDPAVRAPAALVGREQGRRIAVERARR